MRKFFTEKDWKKFREIYLEEFAKTNGKIRAYSNAYRRIREDGGNAPSYKTLTRRLKMENPKTSTETPKTTQKTDYQERLEMIVKLYRRRAEKDCDEICDKLLPELEYEK